MPHLPRLLAAALALVTLTGAAIIAAPAAKATGASATATGHAEATVVRPLTVTRADDLDFGTVTSAADTAGDIAVSTRGVVYSGGARGACATTCAAPHPARFTVAGEAGHGYAIFVPAQLEIAGVAANGHSAATLTVSRLAIVTASRPGAGAHGEIGADGTDSFTIGGTLTLPAALPPAHYHASIPVMVSYD